MIITSEYQAFLKNIKNRIRQSQYDALKAVNVQLIQLYWDIGMSIVEKQQQSGWGKSVVENLAKDLQDEFSGIRGFSAQNLWLMRQFYAEYHDNENLQSLIREIGWTYHDGARSSAYTGISSVLSACAGRAAWTRMG